MSIYEVQMITIDTCVMPAELHVSSRWRTFIVGLSLSSMYNMLRLPVSIISNYNLIMFSIDYLIVGTPMFNDTAGYPRSNMTHFRMALKIGLNL